MRKGAQAPFLLYFYQTAPWYNRCMHPVPDPVQWWRRSVDMFVDQSKELNTVMNEDLSLAPSLWASPKGQDVLKKLEETWSLSCSLWTVSKKQWSPADALENNLCMGSFLDALTNDYLYRTNEALPSGPLWDHLEAAFDMPTMCHTLCRAFESRYTQDATVFHSMYENMIFAALCRPQKPYQLLDASTYENIWASLSSLRTYWNLQDNSGQKRHHSILRCYELLPNPDAFLKYAAQYPLPTETVQYALDRKSPLSQLQTEPSATWFQWLASMQQTPEHWTLAEQAVPSMAKLVQMVSSLEEFSNVGVAALGAYRSKQVEPLGPEVDTLFVNDDVVSTP